MGDWCLSRCLNVAKPFSNRYSSYSLVFVWFLQKLAHMFCVRIQKKNRTDFRNFDFEILGEFLKFWIWPITAELSMPIGLLRSWSKWRICNVVRAKKAILAFSQFSCLWPWFLPFDLSTFKMQRNDRETIKEYSCHYLK